MKRQPVSKLFLAIFGGLFLLLVVSCQSPLSSLLSEDATTVADEAQTTASGSENGTSETNVPNTVADTITDLPSATVITLTFWTTERFSPQIDTVAQQLQSFETANPNVSVEVLQKGPTGQAGILNFLRSAKEVAPSILPDLVVINTQDLPQAWRSNLIQPLDGSLDRTIVQDLLPAARDLGTVDGNLAAIPFEMDVQHLVYNSGKIGTPPLQWSDILSNSARYQFPAGGQNGLLNDALLIQYLATGATLTDADGNPTVDQDALYRLLQFYQVARDNNIIDASLLEANQPDNLWDDYLAGLVGITHINTHRYLSDQRLLSNANPAPIPSPDGTTTVTISRGWAFALVTEDPLRQAQALKLIADFMKSEANANWAIRSAMIPTRQSAFDQVASQAGSDYWLFLADFLTAAMPPPAFVGYDQLSRTLLTAIQQVMRNEAPPDEAVQTAVDALSPATP